MPPRKQVAVAGDPHRRDLLAEFVTNEREIAELRRLPLDEALFRIGIQCEAHVSWAKRKADFLRNEVRTHAKANGRRGRVVAHTVEFVEPRDRDSVGAMRIG